MLAFNSLASVWKAEIGVCRRVSNSDRMATGLERRHLARSDNVRFGAGSSGGHFSFFCLTCPKLKFVRGSISGTTVWNSFAFTVASFRLSISLGPTSGLL